jgi:flagellar motor component MotA
MISIGIAIIILAIIIGVISSFVRVLSNISVVMILIGIPCTVIGIIIAIVKSIIKSNKRKKLERLAAAGDPDAIKKLNVIIEMEAKVAAAEKEAAAKRAAEKEAANARKYSETSYSSTDRMMAIMERRRDEIRENSSRSWGGCSEYSTARGLCKLHNRPESVDKDGCEDWR